MYVCFLCSSVGVKKDPCVRSGKMDIGFVLDSSGSVGDEFNKVVAFCKKIVVDVEPGVGGAGGSRVGVVRYGYDAVVEFGFDTGGDNLTWVLSELDRLSSTKGSGCTNTTGALKEAGLSLFNVATTNSADGCWGSSGCCSSRSGSRQSSRSSSRRSGGSSSAASGNNGRAQSITGGRPILVLMSDGASNVGGDPSKVAKELQLSGIDIYAIGIGSSISSKELKSIANKPAGRYVFRADNFDKLASVVPAMEEGMCGCKCFGVNIHKVLICVRLCLCFCVCNCIRLSLDCCSHFLRLRLNCCNDI